MDEEVAAMRRVAEATRAYYAHHAGLKDVLGDGDLARAAAPPSKVSEPSHFKITVDNRFRIDWRRDLERVDGRGTNNALVFPKEQPKQKPKIQLTIQATSN